MKKLILAAGLFAATLTGISVSYEVLAAEKNPAIVHRQGTYQVVAGHMGSLKSILFLGWEGNILYHAESIKTAWDNMGKAYPAGSDKGETRAKSEIWSNMDDLQAKSKASYGATIALVDAAKSGDKTATVEAFKKLGGTCKACHKEYRKK